MSQPLPASSVARSLTHVARRDDDASMRPLEFALIRRMFTYTRAYSNTRFWLLVLVVIRAIQLPMLTWVLAYIIKGPVSNGDRTGVAVGALLFALLALSTQIVMHYRQRLALELGESVVHDLRRDLFDHLQRLPMSFYHRTKLGRIISRFNSDVENVRSGVQEVLFITLVQLGQMLVAAGFMLWYDFRLFSIVLALVPVLIMINHFFRRRLSITLRRMHESFSRVTATLAESVNGIRVTQGFVRQDENAALFAGLVAGHSRNNYEVMKTQGIYLPLFELNNQMFVAVLLVVGGYLSLSPGHHLAPADLIGFFFMAGMFLSPITVIGGQYNQALTAMAGAERVFKMLDTPPDWEDDPRARDTELRGGVTFDHVSFGYDPSVPVLHDICFSASPGQTVALVGATGSGKTSIINLMAKFHLPTKGRVLLDDVDLNEIRGSSLHRQMAVVLQQNFLFSGTIVHNIRLGRPDATLEDINSVVDRLDCRDLFEQLPNGLDTEVGERGSQLSLGQRQLVCFARALLADPQFIILDEATSSVDGRTEVRIQRAIERLLAKRTSIIIAHRLSTIRHADIVLVLDHGRIVERGTHQELVNAGGHYARLHANFVRT